MSSKQDLPFNEEQSEMCWEEGKSHFKCQHLWVENWEVSELNKEKMRCIDYWWETELLQLWQKQWNDNLNNQ